MSTLYGVNRTKANLATGQYLLAPGLGVGSPLKVSSDTYSMASMTGTSDVLHLGAKLPAGAIIHLIILHVTVAQTSLTFKLGTVYNDDEFLAASQTLLQTAGTYAISGLQYVVGTAATDDDIVLTNAGAAGTAATLTATIIYA